MIKELDSAGVALAFAGVFVCFVALFATRPGPVGYALLSVGATEFVVGVLLGVVARWEVMVLRRPADD